MSMFWGDKHPKLALWGTLWAHYLSYPEVLLIKKRLGLAVCWLKYHGGVSNSASFIPCHLTCWKVVFMSVHSSGCPWDLLGRWEQLKGVITQDNCSKRQQPRASRLERLHVLTGLLSWVPQREKYVLQDPLERLQFREQKKSLSRSAEWVKSICFIKALIIQMNKWARLGMLS